MREQLCAERLLKPGLERTSVFDAGELMAEAEMVFRGKAEPPHASRVRSSATGRERSSIIILIADPPELAFVRAYGDRLPPGS
jgi:hypothetical protein